MSDLQRTESGVTFADDEGLHLDGLRDDVVDLYFDGRRIWSVAASAGKRDGSGTLHIPWPTRMQRRLDGTAHLEVRRNGDDAVVAAGEVSFGSSAERLDFTDAEGRPVTLNKWGRFNYTFDSTPRHVVEGYLDDVEAVLAVLREECGVEAFIAFGTLLGGVREGKVIGHDVDVDLGYLSTCTHPVDVVRESLRIERALRRRGWRVVRQSGGFLAVFFPQADGSRRNLDVFSAFFVDDMLFQVNDIGTPAQWSDVLPLQLIDFEGRRLPAPARPEVFLEAAYGPGWRIPDPGFSFSTSRYVRRRIVGWLGGLRRERDLWSRQYEKPGSKKPGKATDFARWVLDREPDTEVVDVGCGGARDTLFFVRHGRSAVGIDFIPALLKLGRKRSAGKSGSARFFNCNLYSLSDTLRLAARLAHEDRRRTVYARHLLAELGPAGRESFWRLCSMLLRGGGRCYIETPTRPRSAVSGVKPVRPGKLIAEARRRGARLVLREDLPDPADRAATGTMPTTARVTRLILEWT